MEQNGQTAIIIGAGPAGLTAALELCRRSQIKPIVLEATDRIGGLSCTISHNGNRIDIGGHRFFSKSDRVLDFWAEIMPLERSNTDEKFEINYRNSHHTISRSCTSQHHADPECVMLIRPRKSRIYFLRTFFDYPLALSASTVRRLGLRRAIRIVASYIRAQLAPRRPEATLEDFLINRFGKELYLTFFKSYTEKVWGVPCAEISATWGAQRIKGLSLRSAVSHYLGKLFAPAADQAPTAQRKVTETSLVERFLYPKYGPGQLWERVAALIEESGGEIRKGWRVTKINVESGPVGRVKSIQAVDPSGEAVELSGDHFFSTMPVSELIHAIGVEVPSEISSIANGLVYRDFITVGLLAEKLLITEADGSTIKDNWIYVQEPEVLIGRMQIFNNWSPSLVHDPSKVWIGLEYFCNVADPIWRMQDAEMKDFAVREAARIGILNPNDVRDLCVIRVPKAYPAYSGTYNRFSELVRYTDRFENLFLIGRNGMHRYNNQDHSMLTAMVAVDNILAGITDKSNLWQVNTEQEYHEPRAEPRTTATPQKAPVSAPAGQTGRKSTA